MAEKLKDRGSRKHVLDLVMGTDYRTRIDSILEELRFRLANPDHLHPLGRTCAEAWHEYEVEDYLRMHPIADLPSLDQNWWIKHRRGENTKRPTWDLIAHLEAVDSGQPGLLLVEAKAHITELSEHDRKKAPNPASLNSIENDRQIRTNLMQAEQMLNNLHRTPAGRFLLSADSHYQLANRLCYAVKLATLGYDVVLVYLGFCGDTYFPDSITDKCHWHRILGGYIQGVAPQTFIGRRIEVQGRGHLQMIVRALDVLEVSVRKPSC